MTVKPEKTGEIIGFNEWLIGRDFTLYQSSWLIFQPFPLESSLCRQRRINASVGIYLKKPSTLCLAYEKMNYGQIFVSMAQLLKEEKRLLLRALTGAFALPQ